MHLFAICIYFSSFWFLLWYYFRYVFFLFWIWAELFFRSQMHLNVSFSPPQSVESAGCCSNTPKTPEILSSLMSLSTPSNSSSLCRDSTHKVSYSFLKIDLCNIVTYLCNFLWILRYLGSNLYYYFNQATKVSSRSSGPTNWVSTIYQGYQEMTEVTLKNERARCKKNILPKWTISLGK